MLVISVRSRDGLRNVPFKRSVFEPLKVRFVRVVCRVVRVCEIGRTQNVPGVELSGMKGGDPPVLNEKKSQSAENWPGGHLHEPVVNARGRPG